MVLRRGWLGTCSKGLPKSGQKRACVRAMFWLVKNECQSASSYSASSEEITSLLGK